MSIPALDELLGHDLAAQLTPNGRCTVENHARENQAGVRRVAREILRDTTIRNPAAVLLNRLDRGQHKTAAPPRRRSPAPAPLSPPPAPLTPEQLERGRRWAIVAKLTLNLKAQARVDFAIARARISGTDELDAAEHELARLVPDPGARV